MGLRESINNRRGLGLGIGIGLIALAVLGILWPSIGGSASRGGEKAFYTVDDGATWFVEDADKLPPFDYQGKEAVACYVYKCGEAGQPWVSHLMRFTPEGKKQREQQLAGQNTDLVGSQSMVRLGIEVKEAKSADQEWVSISDLRAAAIQELKCPDGSTENMIPLDPND